MLSRGFRNWMFDLYVGIISLIVTFSFFPYGYNYFYLLLASKRYRIIQPKYTGKPTIAIQLPIYNEKYVVSRLVDSCIVMMDEYGRESTTLQLLDDSTDETSDLVDDLQKKYVDSGYAVNVFRRKDREGYKAGALQLALEHTEAEYIVIFDSDFAPTKSFLSQTVPYFNDPQAGIVQCRWSHINRGYNALTKAIALGIDGHFLVEQTGRFAAGCLLNFNGSAGMIRRKALEEAGGWSADTLAEDLDLSYRLQIKGYKAIYLREVNVPCEVPSTIPAFKRQQSRWARGTIQVAKQLIPQLIRSRNLTAKQKTEGVIHLTYYLVHPFMFASFIVCVIGALFQLKTVGIPIPKFETPLATQSFAQIWSSLISQLSSVPVQWLIVYVTSVLCALASWSFYAAVLMQQHMPFREQFRTLMTLTLLGFGISINNSISVFKGLFVPGQGEFKRTPKYAIERDSDTWKEKKYQIPFSRENAMEAIAVVLGIASMAVGLATNNLGVIPILAWYTLSYALISLFTLLQSEKKPPKGKIPP